MNIVERERRALERGPVTLPPRVGHRSPEPPGALLSRILINLISQLQQIGGRRPPSYLLQFVGSQNFIVSRSRFSQLPGREVLLFRATWREPRSDEHRRTRGELPEAQGPVTLPSQGRVHRSPEPPGALLSNTYKILIPTTTDRREETSLLSAAICGSQNFISI